MATPRISKNGNSQGYQKWLLTGLKIATLTVTGSGNSQDYQKWQLSGLPKLANIRVAKTGNSSWSVLVALRCCQYWQCHMLVIKFHVCSYELQRAFLAISQECHFWQLLGSPKMALKHAFNKYSEDIAFWLLLCGKETWRSSQSCFLNNLTIVGW